MRIPIVFAILVVIWLPTASMSAAPAPQSQFPRIEGLSQQPDTDAPPPVMIGDLLQDGVVIVVSKASQRLYVFRDGVLWNNSPVSTGKRGHGTPSGVFAILQKNVKHRSNIYSNAPMPYMQRLTWRGIALHGGYLPGYPASHGCVRLPHAFAQALYGITNFDSTVVIIRDEPIAAGSEAYRIAASTDAEVPLAPSKAAIRFARVGVGNGTVQNRPARAEIRAPTMAGAQTVQLVASASPAEATAHWSWLVGVRPDLAHLTPSIVPATVASKRYYRLRVSVVDARSLCSDLKRAGLDCFAVS